MPSFVCQVCGTAFERKEITAKDGAFCSIRCSRLGPRSVAKAAGEKYYTPKKACINGHTCQRKTSNGSCPECNLLQGRKDSHRNREKRSQRFKEKYRDPVFSEKMRAKHREWLKNNKDKIFEYEQANADRRRELDRLRRQNDPEKYRAIVRNRRALRRSAPGTHTKQDILDLYKAQCGRCVYCRKRLRKVYHVDHRQPLARGGSNDKSNLQILCPTCNVRKSARDPIEFEKSIGYSA